MALDSSGNPVERYHYAPYGEVTILDANFANPTSSSSIGNEHLYTGRRTDPVSGLQLNRNRYYHAKLGRWLTRDPIGYEGGVNLYRYIMSRPSFYIDPSGLDFIYITNDDSVAGAGHSACIIGCPEDGYTLYSYGSDGSSGYESGSSPSSGGGGLNEFPLEGPPFPTFDDVWRFAQGPDQGYDRYVLFPRTREEDGKARECAQKWDSYTYNLFWRNCADCAVDCGRCSGLDLPQAWMPTYLHDDIQDYKDDNFPDNNDSCDDSEDDSCDFLNRPCGGGACCFVAGTTVSTPDGARCIEDICVGDKVWSLALKRDHLVEATVSRVLHRTSTELFKISLEGVDSDIMVTAEHPFYVVNRGWTTTADLGVGDLLTCKGNRALKIVSIESLQETAEVYNMTVNGEHNYFVGRCEVLVHNK